MIKSWNHDNVATAMRDSVWATQEKNEKLLTEAFKTSRHVILLFSVNKSVAFQGYVSTHSRLQRHSLRLQSARASPKIADNLTGFDDISSRSSSTQTAFLRQAQLGYLPSVHNTLAFQNIGTLPACRSLEERVESR